MKKLSTLLIMFGLISAFHLSASAKADKDCLRMLKQANKTCKNQHRCIYEALNAAGFDIVNSGTEVFCKGDPNKGMAKANASVDSGDSPIKVKDRSKSNSDDSPIIKRKSGINFD